MWPFAKGGSQTAPPLSRTIESYLGNLDQQEHSTPTHPDAPPYAWGYYSQQEGWVWKHYDYPPDSDIVLLVAETFRQASMIPPEAWVYDGGNFCATLAKGARVCLHHTTWSSPDSNGWNFRMWLNDKQIAYYSGGSNRGSVNYGTGYFPLKDLYTKVQEYQAQIWQADLAARRAQEEAWQREQLRRLRDSL